MSNENNSQSTERLQKLLQASPEQLNEWDDGEDWLPDPNVYQRETNITKALWNDPILLEDEAEVTETSPGWLSWLRPLFVGPLLAGVAALALFWIAPWQKPPSNPTHVLIGKGNPQTSKHKRIALHLGLWKGKKVKPKRLGNNDSVRANDSVYFGFTLRKTAGYLYLLLQHNKNKPQLILPMPKTQAQRWKQGFVLLRAGKQLSTYQLSEHVGRVQFVVVKTTKKLTLQQRQSLLKSHKVRSNLQGLQKAWKAINPMEYDSMALQVKGSK